MPCAADAWPTVKSTPQRHMRALRSLHLRHRAIASSTRRLEPQRRSRGGLLEAQSCHSHGQRGCADGQCLRQQRHRAAGHAADGAQPLVIGQRATALNGKYPVLRMQEIIAIASAKNASTSRTISVCPEAKNPRWNNAQAMADGSGTGPHRLKTRSSS